MVELGHSGRNPNDFVHEFGFSVQAIAGEWLKLIATRAGWKLNLHPLIRTSRQPSATNSSGAAGTTAS